VEKKCAYCGKQFIGKLARGKFCSRSCYDKVGVKKPWSKDLMNKCEICGTLFNPPPNCTTKKTCSVTCRKVKGLEVDRKYRREHISKKPWSKDLMNKCVICGNLFNPPPNNTSKTVCSITCRKFKSYKIDKKWQRENKEKCAEYGKKYYLKNPERKKPRQTKEKLKASQLKYNKTEKAKLRLLKYRLLHPGYFGFLSFKILSPIKTTSYLNQFISNWVILFPVFSCYFSFFSLIKLFSSFP